MGSSSFRRPSGESSFSASKRYRGDASSADAILKVLLKKHGLDVKIAKYQFVRHWEELVGRQIADKAKPDCIKGRTLVLRVKSSAWAQELNFHRQVILARVNKFFTPDESLTGLRFIVSD